MCVLVLVNSVWGSIWEASSDEGCFLSVTVSAPRVVAIVAQVSASRERRASEEGLELGRTAKQVLSSLLWTSAPLGMVAAGSACNDPSLLMEEAL